LAKYCKRVLDFDLLQEYVARAADTNANDTNTMWMHARASVALSSPTTLSVWSLRGIKEIPNSQAGFATVLEALRLATSSRHAKLASCRAMERLFEPTYTVSEYRAHLGRLLGLFEPLEASVARAAGPSDLASSLQRTRDLREDLLIMGASSKEVDALERCRNLPPIPAQGLLGYTYVILGSSLGARIIVKRLRTVLGPDASLRFYGDEKGRHTALWPVFLQRLEENGRHDIRTICETAVGIFDAYETWLCQ
jgi:heme oxygenase